MNTSEPRAALEDDELNGQGQWVYRVRFIWSGPLSPDTREQLNEIGTLNELGGNTFAWTCPVTGNPGAGTAAQRAGRAEHMVADALSTLISETFIDALDDDDFDAVRVPTAMPLPNPAADLFTHLGTDLIETADPRI